MLIDYTYFFGDLSIGQLSEQSVKDKLNWFIQKYEPEILKGLLGYDTYKQLIAGLAVDPIPSKWSDLLIGAEYTDASGNLRKWDGLLQLSAGSGPVTGTQNQVAVVVGRGQLYDPVASTLDVPVTTTIIPAGLVGKPFVFVQRGYGPLRPDEFSISGNVLTLLGGLIFSNDDTYFYYGDNTSVSSAPVDTSYKLSLIAYYVYYWYQRSQVTNTSGTGESKTDTQNAIPVSPQQKMVTAWNKMVAMNNDLLSFLNAEQEVYPGWYRWASADDTNVKFLLPINLFNLC